MNIFEIIGNLYKTRSNKWIYDLNDNQIQPIIINKFLMMNSQILSHARYLDKYTFNLKPKHWLLLANQLIPKGNYGRVPYIKKKEDDISLDFIITKIKKVLLMGDNDWRYTNKYFMNDIEKNKIKYFKSFGVDKKEWKKHGLDFKQIKKGERIIKPVAKGLDCFM